MQQQPIIIIICDQGELRHITPRAFRARFPALAKARIELMATDVPTASLEQRLQAAAVRAELAENDTAGYVDLERVRREGRLQPFVAAGALTEQEALQILDAPIQPDERP
jgi:hypothetical protein